MHLDADRDGRVDDDWRGLARWSWGRGKRGAVFLCNDDDDDASGHPDNRDGKVNGGNDAAELAPIVIRKEGAPAAPGSWTATLEVSAATAKRVRIFAARAPGAGEVIGPAAGARYTLPDLSFGERELGIEALCFAGAGGWNGKAEIQFRIEDGGDLVHQQTAQLRVAPWMMPSHLEPAEKVFVVDAGLANRRFRADLHALVSGAGCTLQPHAELDDPWMQDCLEIGYSFMPKHHRPVALRAKRDRPLKTFARTLLEPDFGYEEPTPTVRGDNTFDSNGNLEVTPPVRSRAGKEYPWGRIYFGPGRAGERFDARVASFLDAQQVQAPLRIDTSWLAVGHVDEILSFVPSSSASRSPSSSSGGKGFKLLLASPRRAFALLRAASAGGWGASKLLTGRQFDGRSAEVSIDGFLDAGIPGLELSAATLRRFNDRASARLDAIRDALAGEISLDADDLIEVPMIFMPNQAQPIFADALTAGMVNMLVVNGHCIVPKPFGPVLGGRDLFEEDLRSELLALGLTVSFLDDWYEYHVNLGEVHCATNTLRRPKAAQWKWWDFAP
jgi:hypothetical protein